MDAKPRPNHIQYLRALRGMTPDQRLRKAFELGELSRALHLAGLRQRHPGLGQQDLQKLRRGQAALRCAVASPPFSASPVLLRRAGHRGIHATEGDRIDFWPLTDDPFDVSRFARRAPQEILGTTMVASRPEDTILQKLRRTSLAGGSEKQFGDALRV